MRISFNYKVFLVDFIHFNSNYLYIIWFCFIVFFLELALERDSKLENLDQHSLELLSKTKEFQKEAKSIKRQKLMQKIRLYACVLFLIVALILIFYFSIS